MIVLEVFEWLWVCGGEARGLSMSDEWIVKSNSRFCMEPRIDTRSVQAPHIFPVRHRRPSYEVASVRSITSTQSEAPK